MEGISVQEVEGADQEDEGDGNEEKLSSGHGGELKRRKAITRHWRMI